MEVAYHEKQDPDAPLVSVQYLSDVIQIGTARCCTLWVEGCNGFYLIMQTRYKYRM